MRFDQVIGDGAGRGVEKCPNPNTERCGRSGWQPAITLRRSQSCTSRIALAKTGSARSTIASVAVRLILSRPGKPATLPA